MKNIDRIIEVFTNRGYNVRRNDHYIDINEFDDRGVSVTFSYIKNHNSIDDLIIELQSKLNEINNDKKQVFIEQLLKRRLEYNYDEFLIKGIEDIEIKIPNCEFDIYSIFSKVTSEYRIVKFILTEIVQEDVFKVLKIKITYN